MPGLKELQSAFKRNLMLGNMDIAEMVDETAKLGRDLRLEIYGNAYRSRLQEALTCDYEILQTLLGEEAFSELSESYIDAHPSRFFSLRWFGEKLPQYLGYDSDTGSHDWRAEMAQLEWSFVNVFDAADVVLATESDAAMILPEAWPLLSVKFHPSVKVLSLWWNTLPRWRAGKEGESVAEPERLSQASACLLWREDLKTRFRSLETLEAVALHAALTGANFSELCGVLANELSDQEQVPMQAAGFLKTWLSAGMITELVA